MVILRAFKYIFLGRSIKREELMKKTTTEKCIYVLCAQKWEMAMVLLCYVRVVYI